MSNFNERMNTLLYKNIISRTLFSKGLMLVVCEKWAGDRDRLLYWPQVLLTTALFPHLGWSCSTVGHWGPKALCLPLALNLASCPQLAPTSNWLKPSIFWLCFCLTSTCFRCSPAYLHRCISWLTVRSRVSMLQEAGINIITENWYNYQCIHWLIDRSIDLNGFITHLGLFFA